VGRALQKLHVKTVEDALDLCGDHIAQRAQAVPADRRTGGRRPGDGLTPREQELLPLVADPSVPYSRIAQQLGIAAMTVRAHAANIARKLGVHGRAGIAAEVSGGERAGPGPAERAAC